MTLQVPGKKRSGIPRARFIAPVERVTDVSPEVDASPGAPQAAIVWELDDVERYVVRANGRVVGFVDVVGAVFVALRGGFYDRSVEEGQTLTLEAAIALLARTLD